MANQKSDAKKVDVGDRGGARWRVGYVGWCALGGGRCGRSSGERDLVVGLICEGVRVGFFRQHPQT